MLFDEFSVFAKCMEVYSKTKEIFIWGTGVYGDLMGRCLDKREIPYVGYIDNFRNDDKAEVNGKHVFSGDEIQNIDNIFIILSMKNYQAVKKQIHEMNLSEDRMAYFNNSYFFEQLQKDTIDSTKYTKKLLEFKGKHTGERCILIGNGPSLTLEDLESAKEKGLVCFASNMIYKCYDKTRWRPDYHFFVDINGMRDIFSEEDMVYYISQNCKCIFTRSDGKLFDYRENPSIDNLYYFDSIFSKSEQRFDFSEECEENVYIGYSVTYAMMQLAVYMGFKEIYLLGIDHSYSTEIVDSSGEVKINKKIQDHSDIMGNPAMWGVTDVYKITKAYEAAKKYADSHGVKIYNATRGGKLEVFERRSLDIV